MSYNREYQKEWYKRNKEEHIKKVRAWDEKRLNEMKTIALDRKKSGCVACGYNIHPVALDFHHIKDKKFEIGTAYSRLPMNIERFIEELDKCIVLCSNCHRIETYGSLVYRKDT